MLTIYRVNRISYSFDVTLRGNPFRVHIKGGFNNGGGHYSTSDKDLQDAIESSSAFKNGIVQIFFKEEQKTEDLKSTEDENLPIRELSSNLQEAKILLKTKYNMAVAPNLGLENVIELARTVNVEFPNLK